MRISKSAREKLQTDAKRGIIRKLYEDKMITDTQYRRLMKKYSSKA